MIRKFKYTAEDVDCAYCIHSIRKHCKLEAKCPFVAERIEAGVLSYEEVLCTTFPRAEAMFRARIRFLADNYSGSFWNDRYHYNRFEALCSMTTIRRCENNNPLYAALYLLSANEEIFKRSMSCFSTKRVDLANIQLGGISPESYGIAQAAKTLLNRETKITVEDLQDGEIVDTDTFRLIINALLIARYGLDITHLKF